MSGTTAEPGAPAVALALVHFPVRVRADRVGATSVTPLNIHDLARAARTYGAAPLYLVTPVLSQRALIERILAHWRTGHGAAKNPTRTVALEDAVPVDSLNEAVNDLVARHGATPRLVSTGAGERDSTVTCRELAEQIRAGDGSWLIVFGTGWGLPEELVSQCDRHLAPIRGRGDFNHLPVRAAAAIILDRLFGS